MTTLCTGHDWQNDGYYRYAVTLRYRLVFESDGDGAACTDMDGDGVTCEGWSVDDIAFSNDEGHCGPCNGTNYFDFE